MSPLLIASVLLGFAEKLNAGAPAGSNTPELPAELPPEAPPPPSAPRAGQPSQPSRPAQPAAPSAPSQPGQPRPAQPSPPTAPPPAQPGQQAKPAGPVIKDRARLDRAAAAANKVLPNLRAKGKAGYDRALLSTFQREAGLKVDGLYGPQSAGALKWYTGQEPPAPFTGKGVAPYAPNF